MDYGEAASDDHLNIDDNDLPFEFASNGSGCKLPEPCPTTSRVDSSSEDQQRFPGSAQSKGDVNENEHSQSPSRSAHPVYMYVSRTTTEWTCKTCERCFKGPRLFNITRHFKRSHPEIFSEIEALRLQMNPDDVANYLVPLISAATNGIVSSPGVSISSTGSVTKQSLYETHKTSSKQPTKKMKAGNVVSSVDFAQKQIASIVSSGILQPSTFENEEVRRLLSLIPGFTVPNKKAIENLVENDVMTTFSMISQILESTSQMSLMALSVDVQLQEGSHPGFIAVFGHYYDVRAKTFERILIDIADFPDRPPKNSVDGAINEILSKFASRLSLDNHKISRTTVLEVPRLVPAYRKPFINLFTEQDGNQRELEESDYCTVSCCPERLSVIPNCAEKGIQMEKEGLRDKKLSAWIKTSESSKHVSCAAQLMQEVMANVFQEDVEMIKVVKSMTDIFKKITSSVDVVKQLMERTNGNELRIPSSNRWCSVLGSIDVFLTMKSQIEAVCKANRWDFLSEDKLDLISKVTTITNPILRFSERLQAVDSPTVSLLLPGLIKLIEHLKKSGMEISSHYASKLITEVEKLFAHVLHSGEPGYDPIYLVSTLLDRRVAHMVAEYYDTKQQRTIIMNTISQMFPELREKCETSGSEIVLEDSSPFGFGTIASSISVPSATSLEGSELVPYFHRFIRLPTSSSSIEFWMENEHDFPILSRVAVSILSIPASTIQLQPTLTAINERVAKQLQEVQGTKLPKWLRSNIFLAFNEHLTKGEPAPDGLSGNCSDTSCSPLLSKDPPNKASKNRTKFVAVKMECDSNDESSFTPMKEETMLEPASKIRKKHNEERRHSTASSTSSKSSVNGCL